MNLIRLAVIDDSVDFCVAVAESLKLYYGDRIKIIGMAYDGESGIELIRSQKPDVALIDMYMPLSDGVAVVKEAKHISSSISCIILTGAPTEYCTQAATAAGADFIYIKPLDIHRLATYIIDIHKFKEFARLEARLSNNAAFLPGLAYRSRANALRRKLDPEVFADAVLREMGFSAGLKGFCLLKSAIVLCIYENEYLGLLTKLLYPELAKRCKTSPARVERAMRHSVVTVWQRGKPQVYNMICGGTDGLKRPTLGVFLRSMTEAYHSKYEPFNIEDNSTAGIESQGL